MEELQVSLQEEGRTEMTRATLLARGVLVLALAAGNEAPIISDPHIAADMARIRAHPIGEEEAILSTFPVKRQIQIVLHNRMHTAETVLGESIFEKHSGRCSIATRTMGFLPRLPDRRVCESLQASPRRRQFLPPGRNLALLAARSSRSVRF